MRLLQASSDDNFRLASFANSSRLPKYAIFSHTWEAGDQEITYQDIMSGNTSITSKSGHHKIRFCRDQARKDGFDYIWVDSCCIDQRSSAEVSQIVNSMFRLYRDAARCYVYLADVSVAGVAHPPSDQATPDDTVPWDSAFRESRWFTRGWTLQELLAPRSVEFFSCEGKLIGDRKSLEMQIHEITRIPVLALQGATHGALSRFSVGERMSWSENRNTTIEEDKVYCLLGIFDIHIPLIYGEGEERAFIRLQDEIDRRSDASGFGQVKWTQEERRCLQVLHSVDYQTFKDRLPTRVEGTCQWFLEHDHFKHWQQSTSGLLWLSADAHSGKSVLAKSLVDINLDQSNVCYFFFNSDSSRQESASTALSTILHQLFLQSPRLIRHALPDFAFEGRRLAELFPKLWNIFLRVSADSDTIICILDGLDKCEKQGRSRLLRAITQFYRGNLKPSASESHQPKLKFLLTSRSGSQGSDIRNQMEALLNLFPRMHIQGDRGTQAISRDINIVIKDQISTLEQELFREVGESEKILLQEEFLGATYETYQFSKKVFETILGNGDPEDSSILHWAALNGHSGLLRILIETGNAFFDLADDGEFPLLSAAKRGHTAVIKLMLEAKANIEVCDSYGRTALLRAAQNGHDAVIALLLATGVVEVNSKDTDGRTPLSYAAANGHDAVVAFLLATGVVEVNSKDNDGRTPLSYAAKSRRDGIVARLLATGLAEVDSEIIHWAATDGHSGLLRIFIEANNAILNLTDRYGRFPLLLTAIGGYTDMIKLMLEAKADIKVRDKYDRTALSYAARNGHDAVVALLLAAGVASVNIKDKDGRTPLSYAAATGHDDIVAQLLATGLAEIDSKDALERTALSYAAACGHDKIVARLLSTGQADVNLRCSMDRGQRTALSFAAEKGHVAVVKELLTVDNINVNARSAFYYREHHWRSKRRGYLYTDHIYPKGHSQRALWYAQNNGHTDVAQLILDWKRARSTRRKLIRKLSASGTRLLSLISGSILACLGHRVPKSGAIKTKPSTTIHAGSGPTHHGMDGTIPSRLPGKIAPLIDTTIVDAEPNRAITDLHALQPGNTSSDHLLGIGAQEDRHIDLGGSTEILHRLHTRWRRPGAVVSVKKPGRPRLRASSSNLVPIRKRQSLPAGGKKGF